MSMDVSCFITVGTLTKEIDLCSVCMPDYIVYSNGKMRPWRESAKLYLESVSDMYGQRDYRTKEERRKIGHAWRIAEENGGELRFSID